MQDRPVIRTAIPKRRYQIGPYSASLLGEIESGDARAYRYILAFVAAGKREPEVYICAEQVPSQERAAGAYRLLMVSEPISDVLASGDEWGDLDTFAEQALKAGAHALGLQREPVMRLM